MGILESTPLFALLVHVSQFHWPFDILAQYQAIQVLWIITVSVLRISTLCGYSRIQIYRVCCLVSEFGYTQLLFTFPSLLNLSTCVQPILVQRRAQPHASASCQPVFAMPRTLACIRGFKILRLGLITPMILRTRECRQISLLDKALREQRPTPAGCKVRAHVSALVGPDLC